MVVRHPITHPALPEEGPLFPFHCEVVDSSDLYLSKISKALLIRVEKARVPRRYYGIQNSVFWRPVVCKILRSLKYRIDVRVDVKIGPCKDDMAEIEPLSTLSGRCENDRRPVRMCNEV